MTIEVGSFVIINEVDAPICRLVAKVVAITKESNAGFFPPRTITRIKAKYITNYPYMRYCSAELERVTLVSDFGVDVTVTEEEVICEKRRESIAKYKDGSSREWQDHRLTACEAIRKNRRKGESK